MNGKWKPTPEMVDEAISAHQRTLETRQSRDEREAAALQAARPLIIAEERERIAFNLECKARDAEGSIVQMEMDDNPGGDYDNTREFYRIRARAFRDAAMLVRAGKE